MSVAQDRRPGRSPVGVTPQDERERDIAGLCPDAGLRVTLPRVFPLAGGGADVCPMLPSKGWTASPRAARPSGGDRLPQEPELLAVLVRDQVRAFLIWVRWDAWVGRVGPAANVGHHAPLTYRTIVARTRQGCLCCRCGHATVGALESPSTLWVQLSLPAILTPERVCLRPERITGGIPSWAGRSCRPALTGSCDPWQHGWPCRDSIRRRVVGNGRSRARRRGRDAQPGREAPRFDIAAGYEALAGYAEFLGAARRLMAPNDHRDSSDLGDLGPGAANSESIRISGVTDASSGQITVRSLPCVPAPQGS